MVRHRLGAALHVDAFEVGVDELALVELGLDAVPVRLDALVRAGGRVEADDFPRFGEAFLFLGRPLDVRLAGPGRPFFFFCSLVGAGADSSSSSSSSSSFDSSSP